MKQGISLFFLLLLSTLLFLWSAPPEDEGRNMLDGCHHVYLDMGSNTGVQIRYLDKICTVGFEPNMMHKSRLEDLQRSYKNCGWNVVIMVGVGVGAEEKDVRFVHRKKFKLNDDHGTMEKPSVTFFMDQIDTYFRHHL